MIHKLIWAITDPDKLSKTVTTIIKDADSEIVVSAVKFWEISLKHSIGKLVLDGYTPADLFGAVHDIDFQLLDLDSLTAVAYHQLTTTYHRDPFDRMLIWQAIQNWYCLISKDQTIAKYQTEGLNVIW